MFAGGIGMLYWGAERLVRHSSLLAKSIGVSGLVIGLTVVAFGTSSPELLVSAIASFKKNGAIALGNVIGSNIANIGLILGLITLTFPPKPDKRLLQKEFLFLLIISPLVLILSLDGRLSRVDGFILLVLFTFFLYYNIKVVHAKITDDFKNKATELDSRTEYLAPEESIKTGTLRNLLLSLMGLAVLLIGSHLLVKSAVYMAESIGVSHMVIGLSLVALGTSFPELVVAILALIKKEEKINLGMILGSNIFNTLLILGVAALIFPIPIETSDIYINIPVMLLFTLAIFLVLRNIKGRRIIGLFLLLGYFFFILYSYVR